MTAPAIVWLRRDLRLADQPALFAAAQEGPVVCVYVLDDETAKHRALGGASRWWLHHSLESLGRSLARHHSRLILRKGRCEVELEKVARETGAVRVHCLRHYEPWWRNAEHAVAQRLELVCHDGNYLLPPGCITRGSGEPYKIYTPFMKALMERMPPETPLPEPGLSAPARWPASGDLADWQLLPTGPDWAGGFGEAWEVGEVAAQERLDWFADRVADYEEARNLPSRDGSSRLSPHLHWGEISPRQVWHRLVSHRGQGADVFRKELIWRDYAQNVIGRYPDYPEKGYREDARRLRWRDAKADLKAWQQGLTGYPIVDAGMRQLWHTGWMHNRVRMIAASFLIKHLLIDWRQGERWFWDTLVDADYANNGVNWQWVSGSGVDSSMFVRIMAPLTQSRKFDAADYIRRWVPELAELPNAQIHDPDDDHRPASYPAKIIGHREARERALKAWMETRS